jgi:hypothetical protein
VATNAGGVRVLRFGPMRAQLRGIEAVLADGTVVSHLAGLVKDNTGYDYPSLLAGSEGTLAVITAARLRLVPRLRGTVTALAGVDSLDEVHALARRAVREVPGLVSAEFFTSVGLDILVAHAGMAPPLPGKPPPASGRRGPGPVAYLLLEAAGPGALDDLAGVIGDRVAAVAESAADRARLWAYRERHPEAAGFLGVPVKLDVSVPAAQWVRLASGAAAVVREVDPGARVITFGHLADGNVHVNIVPAAAADGRHEDAVFSFVASLGGSISAEHGIGALKARWLPLARTEAELGLFARIRSALDPAGTLNPHVLPRLGVQGGGVGRAQAFGDAGAVPGRGRRAEVGGAQLGHELGPQLRAAGGEQLSAHPQPLGGGAVAQAPLAELGEDRHELDRRLGQAVGGPASGTGVLAGQQARADQPLQPVGEDVGGDLFLGTGQQLAEVPLAAEHHVAQHEQAPAVAERLDRGVDRAARPRWLRHLAPHL